MHRKMIHLAGIITGITTLGFLSVPSPVIAQQPQGPQTPYYCPQNGNNMHPSVRNSMAENSFLAKLAEGKIGKNTQYDCIPPGNSVKDPSNSDIDLQRKPDHLRKCKQFKFTCPETPDF